jgi:hypothetical protein
MPPPSIWATLVWSQTTMAKPLSHVLRDAWAAGRSGDAYDWGTIAEQWLAAWEESRSMQVPAEGQSLTVQAGITDRGLPEVVIRFDPPGVDGGRFTPDEARAHARDVIEASFNAAVDAAVYLYLTSEKRWRDAEAAQLLGGIRRWRADRWGQTELEDWMEG